MRFDEFTTKFQQAPADARSSRSVMTTRSVGPQPLLLAPPDREDGSTSSILSRAGVNVGGL